MKKFPLLFAIMALSLAACSPTGDVSSSSTDSGTSQGQVDHIYLNYSALNLNVGASAQIIAYRQLAGQGQIDAASCSYTSGNPGVASVSSTGLITALATGESLITVTYEGVSATMLLTVSGSGSSGSSTPVPPTASAYRREGSLSGGFALTLGTTSLIDEKLSLPVDLSYTVDTSGHKDTSGYLAFEFSPNETASESVTPANNFSFLEYVFNIQTITNLVAGFLSGVDLSITFPGQYKAMGATYSGFDSVSPYNEYFYLLSTNERSSFASYADVEGTNMVRMQETWDSFDVVVDLVQDVLAYLSTTDLSSVDYVALINEYLEDGELLSPSSGTTVQIVAGVILLLVNQFNITKTSVKVGNYEGVNFRFHPKDETMAELNDVVPTLLDTLGVSLSNISINVTAMDLSLTVYTDGAKNTCLSDIELNIGLSALDSVGITLNLDYEMGHEDTALEENHLTQLVALDKSFDTTVARFESFYAKIAPVVEYYDGDAPSSGVDITDAYKTTLEGYIDEYEGLSSAVKFMLTDKVSVTYAEDGTRDSTILDRYNEGRSALQSATTTFQTAASLGWLTYDTATSLLSTLSGYKNWETALKEYTHQGILTNIDGAEIHAQILQLETEYLAAITTEMASVKEALAAYDVTSSVADTVTLFDRAYAVLCGSSNSLNYFGNNRGAMVLSDLEATLEAAYSDSDAILELLYSSVLAKFKAILDSDLENQSKLDELSALVVGSGRTALFQNYMVSRSGRTFASNGKRATFVEDISGTYTDNLLSMNEALVKAKRTEGYPQYGTDAWSTYVTSANSLIDQISALETAIYQSERTDLSSLRTLVAD